MEKFKAIAVFIRVVEANSFAKAADLLELTPSAVSKAISTLENELGVRLLQRSTRSLRLTAEGTMFYERCHKLLVEYEDIEATLRDAHQVPQGRLRVDMPTNIARAVVFPALQDFLQQYPKVQVELGVNDRLIDLIQEGYDAVIRYGELKDSRLIARHLYKVRYITCAAPAYLAQYGEPKTPAALLNHNCITYFHTPSGHYHEWQFEEDGKRQSLLCQGTTTASNSDILIDAALAGIGIHQSPDFAVLQHLELYAPNFDGWINGFDRSTYTRK